MLIGPLHSTEKNCKSRIHSLCSRIWRTRSDFTEKLTRICLNLAACWQTLILISSTCKKNPSLEIFSTCNRLTRSHGREKAQSWNMVAKKDERN